MRAIQVYSHKTMGCSSVDMKQGERMQKQVNTDIHQMLGGETP